MSIEYQVVWKWKTKFGELPERKKIYKTLKGATRFYDKLNSGGGVFKFISDEFWDTVETYTLDYARIEEREVTPWKSYEKP